MLVLKEFQVKALPPMAPEDGLAAINRLALEPLTAADVYIGKALLANDRVDRSYEKFPLPYLERFAETLPGKPILEGHDKSRSPSGRWFAAAVERTPDGVTNLVGHYYLPAGSDLTARVKLGIASMMSIGFKAAGRTCDLCGSPYDGAKQCEHQAGHEYDGKLATVTYSGDTGRVEALEGSFVWVGCQRGAQAVGMKSYLPGGALILEKEAVLPDEPAGQGDEMEKVELEARVKLLESENGELKAATETLKQEAALAAEGKQYRSDLISEIARKLGVLKRPAEQMLKLLESADVATLKGLDDGLGQEINLMFPPAPQSKMLGQPNGAALIPGAAGTDAGGEPITLEKFLEKRIRGGTFNNWTGEAE